MWISSELVRTRPVLQRVVKDPVEAVSQIPAIDGLTVQVMGHVIVNERWVARHNKWPRWANWTGVLAESYDISQLAFFTGLYRVHVVWPLLRFGIGLLEHGR